MRDFLAQDVVGRQPDRVEIARLFQPRIDRRDRVGGVGAEEAQDVPRGIPGDHRIEIPYWGSARITTVVN
jgi:hypothetical protein